MHIFLQIELIGFLLLLKLQKKLSAFNGLLYVGELDVGGRSGHGFRVAPHSGLCGELISASSSTRLSWDLSQKKACSEKNNK